MVSSPSPTALALEVAALPPAQRLVAHRAQVALVFRAAQAPGLMAEVGRLREATFRAVGEGTGNDLDLDRFDDWYDQLIVWDERDRRVVGGYRLGDVAAIRRERGAAGLYTSTLWRVDDRFLSALPPALELGRTFIRAEDQRAPVALSLLWRGIGEWLSRRPAVRSLFGPVSLSRTYSDHSLGVIVGHFRARRLSPVEAPVPRRPARLPPEALAAGAAARDLAELDAVVAAREPDGKGLPILVRHYGKLGARLLSANEDPAFANVIDLLIEVAVDRMDPRRVRRFMGPGAAAYLAAGTSTSPSR